MNNNSDPYYQEILEDLATYKDLDASINASMMERLWVRQVNADQLHANPDDEFSMEDIGPNEELVSLYRDQMIHNMKTLGRQGFEVWIYTSSHRTEKYIRRLFALYGIRFDGIVNAQRHRKEVQKDHHEALPSKMPGHYRISLHVDDENIVASYGKTYGFEVFQLNAQDDDWAEKIISRACKIRNDKENLILLKN